MADARNPKTGQFLPGNGGRPQGTRNKCQENIRRLFDEEWSDHSAAMMKLIRVDKPLEWAKLIVGTMMPKQMVMSDEGPLSDMADDELEDLIAQLRAMKDKKAA